MRVRVKLMRRRGIRLSDRDIANAPTYEGDLSAAYLRTSFFVSLSDPDNPIADHVLPILYEAVLTGMGRELLTLRGVERIQTPEGRMAVVQEWLCEVIHPAAVSPD